MNREDPATRLAARLRAATRQHASGALIVGCLAPAALALLGVALLLVVDRLLAPDTAVRIALLGLGILALAGHTVQSFLWRRRHPPTRDDHARNLALCLEDTQDLVRSAVDFLHRPGQGESESLRHAVVLQAASKARDTDTGPPPPRGLARVAWILASGLAVLAVFVVLDPVSTAVGLRRTLLLEGLDYPTRTRMVLLGHEPGVPLRLVRGEDLRLTATASGLRVREATLHRLTSGGRIRQAMTLLPDNRFVTVIEGCSTPERFFLTGGDDQDEHPVYAIQILDPPRVLGYEGVETFPAYTNRPPCIHRDPALSLLQGSRVTLTVTTSRPIHKASLRLGPGEARPMRQLAPTRFQSAFDPTGHHDYAIHIVDTEGLENRPAPIHSIRFYPDRAPTVRLLQPAMDGPFTARAHLEIRAEVEDDFGVERVLGHLHPEGFPDRGRPEVLGNIQGTTVVGALVLESCRIHSPQGLRPPEPGDRLAFRVAALDGLDQAGRSRAASLVVATDTEVESHLLSRILEVKHGLEARADRLERAGARLAAYQTAHPDPARLADRTRNEIHGVAGSMREAGAAAAGAGRRLARIEGLYLLNRIGAETRIPCLREAVSALGKAEAGVKKDGPRAVATLKAILDNREGDGPAAMRRLHREIIRATKLFRSALRILSVFVNFREVVRHARLALEAQEDVHATLQDILRESALGQGVALLLDAGLRGIRVVTREIDQVRRGLDVLVNDPAGGSGPAAGWLRTCGQRLEKANLPGLAGQIHRCLAHRRPGDGLGASQLLLAHLRALYAELARLSAEGRMARTGTPTGEKGSLDPRRLEELLKKAEGLHGDLKKATRDLESSALTEALKKLLKKAEDLGKDLGRMQSPPTRADETDVHKAHPESLRRMLKRVRQKLVKGDTRGAVILSEDLLNRLRKASRRKARIRPEIRLDVEKRARPPDPRGQNLSGEYRPESGVTAPGTRILPGLPPQDGAALRWGELPPVRGGGSFQGVPGNLPGRYRRALESYYRRLGEAR